MNTIALISAIFAAVLSGVVIVSLTIDMSGFSEAEKRTFDKAQKISIILAAASVISLMFSLSLGGSYDVLF